MLLRVIPLVVAGSLLGFAPAAEAARTVYFADPARDVIAGYAVGTGGALTPLGQPSVVADGPRRLAMTSGGGDLYAAAEDGVLEYDVGGDGRLVAKPVPLAPVSGELHSIAVHPDNRSLYVTDAEHGKVRQFDIGPGGQLSPKQAASVSAGAGTRGLAVSPNGRTAYALVAGGIVVYDVGPGGSLARRATHIEVPGSALEDVSLTPNAAHLYATSADGRAFQFDVLGDGTPVPKAPAAVEAGAGTAAVGIAVAPDGSAVYVAAGRSWSWTSRQVLSYAVGQDGGLRAVASAEVGGQSRRLSYLTASPDGRSLFAAGGDGYLFDLGPGAAIAPKASPSVELRGAIGVVVSPNQPPVARFSASTPGVAGRPIAFDASAAADPDGSIARYSWDFGDGTVLPDGGPAPHHVYATPGTYTVTLVVTDNEGASTTIIFTGGSALGGGAPGARANQRIQVAEPPHTEPNQVLEPRPSLGKTLVAEPVSGTVLVRRPGGRRFVRLQDVAELPVGSTFDTTRGRVEIATVSQKVGGGLQHGRFYGGQFTVRQRRQDRYVTELVLRGTLAGCTGGRRKAHAAAHRRRRVWGDGKGRFRTRGRYSSGAVRGTKWLTEDRCDGTLTLVRRGRVAVRDFLRHKTILVRAGHRYLVRRR